MLQASKANPPAFVILDIRLPKINGLEVLRWMRSHSEFTAVPGIVMIGSAGMVDQLTAAYLRSQHSQPAQVRVQIGDRDFDRNGIGRPDEDRHRGDHDDHWRYHHVGNDLFYWNNGWRYYRNGQWIVYDPEVYVAPSLSFAPAVQAIYPGPWYYDSAGFYFISAGRKIYDQRVQLVQ